MMNDANNPVNESAQRILEEIRENEPPATPPEQYEFHDEEELVAALNARIAMVNFHGKTRFIRLADPDLHFYTRADMETQLRRYRFFYEVGEGQKAAVRMKPAFNVWLESPSALTFEGVVFQPDPAKVPRGALNRFTGFAVQPEEGGSYDLFRQHVEENVCGADPELAAFVWDWAADILQNPSRKCPVALMLRGAKGVGKSLFSSVLARIIDEQYCPVIDSETGLVGRFSAHLENALLLVVEEAYHAGNPAHEARLKSLISGRRIPIERKGVDSYTVDSFFRVVMTSNSDHVLPASAGERRFVAMDVLPTRKQDGAYFGEMLEELEAGGYAQLAHDLMHRDLSGRDFYRPPMTDALADQIRLSLKPEEAWWAGVLATGAISFSNPPEGVDGELEWPMNGPLTVERAHLLASFRQNSPTYRGPPSPEALGRFLRKTCPAVGFVKATLGYGRRANCYTFPPRAEALASFTAARPGLHLEPECEREGTAEELAAVSSDLETNYAAAVVDLEQRRQRRQRRP